jgi:hypothetical protein
MYTGSLIGCGALSFAVMGFIIAHAQPVEDNGVLTGYVEVNPSYLAKIFGEEEGDVQRAIDFLCRPDPKSRSPEEEGRRLVKIDGFTYRVVNFRKYREGRDVDRRRKQNREAQARWREKKRRRQGFQKPDGERNIADLNGHCDKGTPMPDF